VSSVQAQSATDGHQTEGVSDNLLYLALEMSGNGGEASYCDAVPLDDSDVFLLCTDCFWHGIDGVQMLQALQQVNRRSAVIHQVIDTD